MHPPAPRIVLFTGDGKGKTTAAYGMALRFLGHGKRVLIARFCKNAPSGETTALAGVANLAILDSTRGMTPPPDHPDYPEHVKAAETLFADAVARSRNYDFILLDEICGAVRKNLLPEDKIVAFLESLAPDQTVALTGRAASVGLLALADTASESLCLKHGYRKGITAQAGVEW